MRRYLVLAIGVCIAAGCISNDRSLLINGATGFKEDCTINASETDFLVAGTLDIAPAYGPNFPLVYYNAFKVQNFLYSTSGESLDSNKVLVEWVRVRLEWLRGKNIADPQLQLDLNAIAATPEQSFPLSGVIDSGSDGKPGTSWITMKLLDSVDGDVRSPGYLLSDFFANPDNVTYASNLILGLHIQVEGTTTGGQNITSNEFIFPVQFCYGCLAAGRNGSVPVYMCCQDTPSLTDDYFPYCGGIQDAKPTCEDCDSTTP